MKSEQWKWVDIAKGIGIILVFLGHFNIPDTLRAEIYTFHMPLFFFLSGVVFNGDKPINRFLGDEAKRMIVPYYCWAFFYFVLFKLLVQTVRGQSVNIGKDVYTYLTMGRKDTIWFLSALLCVQVMAYIYICDGSKITKRCLCSLRCCSFQSAICFFTGAGFAIFG